MSNSNSDSDSSRSSDDTSDDANDGASDESSENMISHAEHKENGNKAYQQKDYRAAIAHYTLAIELAKLENEGPEHGHGYGAPTDDIPMVVVVDNTRIAAYYGNRAAAFTMLLKYQEALDDCDHAIQVDPTFTKAHFRKAKLLTTIGKLDDAKKAYSYGLIHDPNHSNALKERREVQIIQDRFDLAKRELDASRTTNNKKHARQALAQVEIVLASSPSWNEATLIKIDTLSRLNRIEEAYSLSTKLMRLGHSNNNELIFIRAKCLFYQGALDDAMKHLRMILSGDPDNKEAFQMVKMVRALKKKKEDADTAYKNKDYEQAIQLYANALNACPPENISYTAKLYFNRAVSHNALRQHTECVTYCSKALALDNEYQKAYLRRAASNLLIGGKQECSRAITDYETAERLAKTEEEKKDIHKKIQNAKVQLKRAGRKDLYKTMGVSRDANESEIKKAYRKLALKHHPDRQKGNEEEKKQAEATFREINLANEILSDPQKRRRYDQGVDEQDIDDPNARPGGHSHGHGSGGMDQEMLFQMFMQQQQGGGGKRRGGGGGFHFG